MPDQTAPANIAAAPNASQWCWSVGTRTFDLQDHGMIMGILNVTPDSFSDGGKFAECAAAVRHASRTAALAVERAGAALAMPPADELQARFPD